MKKAIVATVVLIAFVRMGSAQVDDICSEFGIMPSLDSPFQHIPYVFGRVYLNGFSKQAKAPKVMVIYIEGQHTGERLRLNESGNFCFRRRGNSGTLVVEVDGIEVARRMLPISSAVQQREDFEVYAAQASKQPPPSVVSAKFSHPANEKTAGLYKKAIEAETAKDTAKMIEYLKQIVAIDAADFIAWAKLGAVHFEQKNLTDSEAAFRKCLELKIEYTPAWNFMGRIRMAQKQYLAAIEILKYSASLDRTNARTFQLLGEAYLQAKQGTLGVAALNEAIRLDPTGMAECHLRIAHLYELVGARNLAAREYKQFLAKVPDHPDKKKFERYIKDNPE